MKLFSLKKVMCSGVPVMPRNKYRLCAPAGPDAQTAARFPRRSGKRYAPVQ